MSYMHADIFTDMTGFNYILRNTCFWCVIQDCGQTLNSHQLKSFEARYRLKMGMHNAMFDM